MHNPRFTYDGSRNREHFTEDGLADTLQALSLLVAYGRGARASRGASMRSWHLHTPRTGRIASHSNWCLVLLSSVRVRVSRKEAQNEQHVEEADATQEVGAEWRLFMRTDLG